MLLHSLVTKAALENNQLQLILRLVISIVVDIKRTEPYLDMALKLIETARLAVV